MMLSASTAQLVAGVVEMGPPQRVRIKNSDVPVVGRLLLGTAVGSPGWERPRSALVGRDAQLRALRSRVEAACNGAPTVVVVVAQRGIGKSRLVA